MGKIKKTYFIADVGSNWNVSKDWNICAEYIEKFFNEFSTHGIDAIKFQFWNTSKFVHKDHPSYNDYLVNEFPSDKYKYVYDLGKKYNVDILVTPFDTDIADRLRKNFNQKVFKIASGDFTYNKLINHILNYGDSKLIISTGNCTDLEKQKFIDTYTDFDITLLHCVSKYPHTFKESGLYQVLENSMTLPSNFNSGYSSHVIERDFPNVAFASCSFGANIIEFHGKLDGYPSQIEKDHSISPEVFGYTKSLCDLLIDTLNESPKIYKHESKWGRRNLSTGLRPVHLN